MKKLTFWFEFASTYSYLSALRIAPLAKAAGVEVVWKPFLLGPIFAAQGMTDSPFNMYPVKGKYMWRDMERECVKYGLPVAKEPAVFPGNGMLAARVATLGLGQDWGADFVRGVYLAHFVDGKTLSDAAAVSGVLDGLGLDGAGVISQVLRMRCAKQQKRRRRWVFLVRRGLPPRMVKCFGAMIDWRTRWRGQFNER